MRQVPCSQLASIGRRGWDGAGECHHSRLRRAFFSLLATTVLSLPFAVWTAAAALPSQGDTKIAAAAGSTTPCGEPGLSLSPESGGLTKIFVDSSCRAGELVSIAYADATLVERLDANGHSAIRLDCFAGDVAPISITFEDGTSITRQPVTNDLTKYSKVAILWSRSVDLDLHAFEYAAAPGDPGHVWSRAPQSLAGAEARAKREKRGRGFLSTASAGRSIGMNVEVYTFAHYPGEKPAGVKMGVEFVSRGRHADGEYCGTGRYAEVHFKAYMLEKGRLAKQLDLAFASLPCGTDISDAAKINSRLIPELTIRE